MNKLDELKKNIEQEIQDTDRYSKTRFVVKSALIVVVLLALLLLTILAVSLCIMSMNHSRPFLFLMLGRMGLLPFMLAFPWLPLLIVISSIALIEWIGVKKGPLFKQPLLISLVALFIISIFTGFLVFNHPMMKRMEFFLQEDVRTIRGSVDTIEGKRMLLKGVHRGEIEFPLHRGELKERFEKGDEVWIMFDKGVDSPPLMIKRVK